MTKRNSAQSSDDERYSALAAPSIFDLLEPLGDALLAAGGPDIRCGYARATGGVDIPYIVEAVAGRYKVFELALRELESANETLCAARTKAQYLSLVDAGQEPLLERLDSARRNARSVLGQGGV
jgi:hypothetical protein